MIEPAQEYAERLAATFDYLPVEMIQDIRIRLGDLALSGGPMDAPYIRHIVENAEQYKKEAQAKRYKLHYNVEVKP